MEASVLFACSANDDNGKIILDSHHEGFNFGLWPVSEYIFSWHGDHPITLENNNRIAKDLKPGNYTVTIDHRFSDCTVQKTFTIGIEDPIEIIDLNIEPSCGGNPTGKISFDYSGGFRTEGASYLINPEILWDGKILPFTIRENLAPGEYCVKIYSNCSTFEECFVIPDVSLGANW